MNDPNMNDGAWNASDKITTVLRELCGDDLAAKLLTRTPEFIQHMRNQEDDYSFLREVCGVPDGARLYMRDDGEIAYSSFDERGAMDGTVPSTSVVDYLCHRVTTLQNELKQVREHHYEAMRIIEGKREKLQTLKNRVAKFADETPHVEVKDTLAAILAQV